MVGREREHTPDCRQERTHVICHAGHAGTAGASNAPSRTHPVERTQSNTPSRTHPVERTQSNTQSNDCCHLSMEACNKSGCWSQLTAPRFSHVAGVAADTTESTLAWPLCAQSFCAQPFGAQPFGTQPLGMANTPLPGGGSSMAVWVPCVLPTSPFSAPN